MRSKSAYPTATDHIRQAATGTRGFEKELGCLSELHGCGSEPGLARLFHVVRRLHVCSLGLRLSGINCGLRPGGNWGDPEITALRVLKAKHNMHPNMKKSKAGRRASSRLLYSPKDSPYLGLHI